MTTILEVLEKGTRFLENKSVPEARLNMELLVAHELGLKRMDLYLRFDQPLAEDNLASLRELLKKRGERIPLQHLVGSVTFGKHEFKCDSRALIPRPETEELVSILLAESFPKPARILDLGCGSGVIGITLAKELGDDCRELVLADVSGEALSLARENAEALEVEATFLQTDLFDQVEGSFDLIAANLPYVPEIDREELETELSHDPEAALFSGPDGLDHLREFCKICPNHLSKNGLVGLEIGHKQSSSVTTLLKDAGMIGIKIMSDLQEIPRFPLARRS